MQILGKTLPSKFTGPFSKLDGLFANASFTPAQLPNLKLWLPADTLALNDGDPVGSWADQSGVGNTVAQATTSAKPTYKTGIVNSKPVVRFDGVDDTLARATGGLTGQVPFTIIIAAKFTASVGAYMGAATLGTSASRSATLGITDAGFIWVGGSSDGTSESPGADRSGAFHVFTRRNLNDGSASSVKAYIDGVERSLTVATQTVDLIDAGFTIGGPGNANITTGDIAEVIIVSGALSDTDRQAAERYLGTKYGITVA